MPASVPLVQHAIEITEQRGSTVPVELVGILRRTGRRIAGPGIGEGHRGDNQRRDRRENATQTIAEHILPLSERI
jgi:hypothetical protein